MNWRRNGNKDDTRESAKLLVARHWRCIASGPQPSQTWPSMRDAFLLLGPWIIGTASSAAKRSSTQAPIRRTVLLRLLRCILRTRRKHCAFPFIFFPNFPDFGLAEWYMNKLRRINFFYFFENLIARLTRLFRANYSNLSKILLIMIFVKYFISIRLITGYTAFHFLLIFYNITCTGDGRLINKIGNLNAHRIPPNPCNFIIASNYINVYIYIIKIKYRYKQKIV